VVRLAWILAADQTKVNKPGLAFAALFAVMMVVLLLRVTQLNRRRSKRAIEYAREEHVGDASAPPLPAHTWQPIANPDRMALFGLPSVDAAAVAQMPALARFIVHQAERGNTVENARSTTLANTTLVVFDHLQEEVDQNRTRIERTVCGRFGLDVNIPWLEVSANQGFGTYVAGGSHEQVFKFESDDFNQAFSVIGADQKFAFTLFDGEMMRWFLAHPQLRSLHLRSAGALTVFTPENPATDADAVFAFVSGFLSRIPTLVRQEWPGR
jgi:hypothetical protein